MINICVSCVIKNNIVIIYQKLLLILMSNFQENPNVKLRTTPLNVFKEY